MAFNAGSEVRPLGEADATPAARPTQNDWRHRLTLAGARKACEGGFIGDTCPPNSTVAPTRAGDYPAEYGPRPLRGHQRGADDASFEAVAGWSSERLEPLQHDRYRLGEVEANVRELIERGAEADVQDRASAGKSGRRWWVPVEKIRLPREAAAGIVHRDLPTPDW